MPEKHSNSQFGYYNDSISISDILLTLAKNIKIIIITPVVICSIAVVYILFFAEPIFSSTAKIMTSGSGGSSTSEVFGLASQLGVKIPTRHSGPKWVYSEILKSRTLAKAVLKQNFYTKEHEKQKTLLQILTSENNNPEYSVSELEIIGVNKLLEMLKVSEDRKTSIFTIEINAREPNLAAEINQSYIKELDTHQKKFNKAKASDTKQFILERIIDTEKDLSAAEENLKVFRDRNRRIENSPSLLLQQQRLGREAAVLTGVYTTLKQQLETTKIEEVKESDYVIILDHPEVPLFRSKPNKKQIAFYAVFIGIILGFILAILKELALNLQKKEKAKLGVIKALFSENIFNFFKKIK